ncbi:hypothetical protein Q8A67_023607 [Cirrhinus molitorella]|uniref:L27 domain-containing protein n=1 Tax=Cirrhinus molitorella TaxID=172907 RepID=A0AA88P636_9TELE|nr:hypothetical protein Q8A67_023607 [Cirrhinus molitorella]
MPLRKRDTARAISLLEDYCSKLKKPEEQQLKTAILRVMGIFKSSLFQALIDIQEFYEVTLLNYQKSCEQKLVEVNHMAEQWEHTATNSTSPTEGPQPASTSPELREEIHMELTVEEPAAGSANTESPIAAVFSSLDKGDVMMISASTPAGQPSLLTLLSSAGQCGI